jgi:hypothetical protein
MLSPLPPVKVAIRLLPAPDLLGISRPGAADSQKIGDIFNSRVQGDNYPDTGGESVFLLKAVLITPSNYVLKRCETKRPDAKDRELLPLFCQI